MAWKGDTIISFCLGESTRKVNLSKQTANKLQVARQTASYKMWHGLATGPEKQLIDKLREGLFSFNIDEVQTFIKCFHRWYPTFVLQKTKLLLNTLVH